MNVFCRINFSCSFPHFKNPHVSSKITLIEQIRLLRRSDAEQCGLNEQTTTSVLRYIIHLRLIWCSKRQEWLSLRYSAEGGRSAKLSPLFLSTVWVFWPLKLWQTFYPFLHHYNYCSSELFHSNGLEFRLTHIPSRAPTPTGALEAVTTNSALNKQCMALDAANFYRLIVHLIEFVCAVGLRVSEQLSYSSSYRFLFLWSASISR